MKIQDLRLCITCLAVVLFVILFVVYGCKREHPEFTSAGVGIFSAGVVYHSLIITFDPPQTYESGGSISSNDYLVYDVVIVIADDTAHFTPTRLWNDRTGDPTFGQHPNAATSTEELVYKARDKNALISNQPVSQGDNQAPRKQMFIIRRAETLGRYNQNLPTGRHIRAEIRAMFRGEDDVAQMSAFISSDPKDSDNIVARKPGAPTYVTIDIVADADDIENGIISFSYKGASATVAGSAWTLDGSRIGTGSGTPDGSLAAANTTNYKNFISQGNGSAPTGGFASYSDSVSQNVLIGKSVHMKIPVYNVGTSQEYDDQTYDTLHGTSPNYDDGTMCRIAELAISKHGGKAPRYVLVVRDGTEIVGVRRDALTTTYHVYIFMDTNYIDPDPNDPTDPTNYASTPRVSDDDMCQIINKNWTSDNVSGHVTIASPGVFDNSGATTTGTHTSSTTLNYTDKRASAGGDVGIQYQLFIRQDSVMVAS